jgi:excisionase family DNA binding protein
MRKVKMALSGADIDAIADAVADRLLDRLAGQPLPTGQLLTASEAAERLGVSKDYIYAHADDLGALRIGDGPDKRPRLRFSAADLDSACSESKRSQPAASRTPKRKTPRHRPQGVGQKPDLLPIRRERRA